MLTGVFFTLCSHLQGGPIHSLFQYWVLLRLVSKVLEVTEAGERGEGGEWEECIYETLHQSEFVQSFLGFFSQDHASKASIWVQSK